MNLLPFLAGGLVVAIFIFRRDLLIQPSSFKIILAISSSLFVLGLSLHLLVPEKYPGSGAFLAPFLTLALYRFTRLIFKRRFGREPRDTYLDWREGMGADRFFNIIYFSLAILIWVIAGSFVS